ncbi:MAG: sirohydrochlorin cobaltochelatase [Termitinemataceae bacterium]|nr:MAG: sirohydrochlorin cobaltochelatase [Termitinemataceae bacterium]
MFTNLFKSAAVVLILVFMYTGTSCTRASNSKPVILVVSFGTSFNGSRTKTIGAIENAIAAAYPQYEVRRAFTSQIIVDHIEQRDGEKIDNIESAMTRLQKDGVKELVVQATQVMSGSEYDEMRGTIKPYEKNFKSVSYGAPLLSSDEDYAEVAKIITDDTKQYASPDSAVVLMGHGSEHPANAAYAKFQDTLISSGYSNYIIGTVEASPGIDDVIAYLDTLGVKKVTMLPFMIVAGDHANNDMAGDKDDSWKSILKSKGITASPVLKGLGESPAIQQVFVKHAGKAINSVINNSVIDNNADS